VSQPQHRIEVQSIVSAADRTAYVQIRGAVGQMTPDEARDLALNLLQAAEAAQTDALILRFVRDALDGDERAAAVLLGELRQMRGEAQRQDWRKGKG
jgi:hypothetical protein